MPSDDLLTRIDNLERLRCAATPAPWDEIISSEAVRYLGPTGDDVTHGDYICAVYDPRMEENKTFIAAARNTTLLTEARDEIVRLRQALAMAELQRDLHKRTLDSTIKVITSKPLCSSLDDKVSDSLKRSEHDHE